MFEQYLYSGENCQTHVKMSITDILGRTVILSRTHASDWRVSIVDKSNITVITFGERTAAMREFNRYRRL